ncbi:hypothetical protein WOLCODRAFT_153958 [Wolfiporia cocos MD-104 SS10]|uniref:Uncharacterized protein n=1 Tax=Wolfiporia cocos (strain MD-104) TaxID=742152 RepID=A0A2H3JNZ7_WOLCO|nr:hypothetical protein WOLCODRAFT_153958 [Wolfiporia cocos MD-104 SS10]
MPRHVSAPLAILPRTCAPPLPSRPSELVTWRSAFAEAWTTAARGPATDYQGDAGDQGAAHRWTPMAIQGQMTCPQSAPPVVALPAAGSRAGNAQAAPVERLALAPGCVGRHATARSRRARWCGLAMDAARAG